MGNTFLIILCVVALPAPFLLFQDWRVHQGHIKQRPEKRSCLAMVVLVLVEALSVGAISALIGYGFGRFITSIDDFSSYSFGGLVSLPLGSGLWIGFCGLAIGFFLALNRIVIEFASEQEPD